MKIGILRIGKIENYLVKRVQENLRMAFPKTHCVVINETLPVPKESFDKTRNQYRSDIILNVVHIYAEKRRDLDCVLGVVDVDIFAPNLNFVFGEAQCPGKAALISLWRLRPEFYGKNPNMELFVERSTKEAVHELGHTFGLGHCPNPYCVMHFSNSIFETDVKQSLFCNKCYPKIEIATTK